METLSQKILKFYFKRVSQFFKQFESPPKVK